MDKQFTVFVGGVEVNDHLLTEEEGLAFVEEYELEGYDDVVLVKIDRGYLDLAQAIVRENR